MSQLTKNVNNLLHISRNYRNIREKKKPALWAGLIVITPAQRPAIPQNVACGRGYRLLHIS